MSYLWLPSLRAQNANALQSPFVYGVPSPPTWMGFADALMRDIGAGYSGVGALIQRFEAVAYGSTKCFSQARHPLKRNGVAASINEEAKCHLTASVLIELTSDIELTSVELARLVEKKRLAGGAIAPIEEQHWPKVVDENDPLVATGNWLTISDEQFNSLDEWVELTQHHHRYIDGKWAYERSDLIPLMIGYAALEKPAHNPQSRDPSCPLIRVEALHGAGRFIAHQPSIEKQSVLFRRNTDLSAGLFVCN